MTQMKAYDVIIAGAGIIGGAIAFELAQRELSALVIDRQSPGQEASWAAAGMLSPAPDAADAIPLVPLARASLKIYSEFVAAVEAVSGMSAGFRPYGAIETFFDADAENKLSAALVQHKKLGLDTELLDVEDAAVLEPHISREIRTAALLRSEAAVDNRAFTRAILRGAEVSGVEFHTNLSVEKLAFDETGTCVGVIASGEKIPAKHVVVAAGFASSAIEGLAQYAPTIPMRGQMVALQSETVDLHRVVRSERGYIVPRGNGRCVTGSTIENVGLEKRVTPQGINKILSAAIEMVPALKDAAIVETWCGLRPDTPDHLPSLGPTDIEGLLIATGHFRNGILLAPITAKSIAEWITSGNTPVVKDTSVNWEVFSPMRFAKLSASAASERRT
jgi:glycine oxidase